MIDKKTLSERDICTKFITPALEKAGWDKRTQFLEEVSFTAGKIHVRGKLTGRGQVKRADYILYHHSNPIAIIEAKDNQHSIHAGMQQGLNYAALLDIPVVFSSNGDGFVFHDRTNPTHMEQILTLDEFPSPQTLWLIYKKFKDIATLEAEKIAEQPYYQDGSGRKPRYYQQIAINRTVEAIAKGQNRILLVMATGTGKTYTAFQIAYRLWKAKAKKRILFLADRTVLIDQTRRNDFKHFADKMTVVQNRNVDKAYEVYLALYQGLTSNDADKDIFKQFSPSFFDLIIIDECHRGSARSDSAWREILDYFHTATHIGLTATPKETKDVSNMDYFGTPLYTYSLKQGIDDGFLAPYRVVRLLLNVDSEGWRPPLGFKDKWGKPVEDRIYNQIDFDKKLVIEERRKLVAQKITEFLKGSGDRFAKTIVFCCDIEHAAGMRSALANENVDLVAENYKYIVQITGDNDEGKRELDHFINIEERYPVIATTSELMTTGVDAQTCKLIVLDTNIHSMTKFKQIVGRGTRIREDFGKLYFTILDFRNATALFADKDFDGDPLRVKPITQDEDPSSILAEEEADNAPIFDEDSNEQVVLVPPTIRTPILEGSKWVEPTEKVYVNGIEVTALVVRELVFDQNGKLLTKSLKEHTHDILEKRFKSLDDFLNHWNAAERKQVMVAELQNQGLLVEELEKAVAYELDLFDMICHLAYDQLPLTRQERAKNVKKRNVFTKYGAKAALVLDALLDKYADAGIDNLESMDVLKVAPFDKMGSPVEILKRFGGKKEYLKAIKALQGEIYKVAS